MVRVLVRTLSVSVLFFLCFSLALWAQDDEATTTGLPPFGSFHGSDFDVIMLQNGNLHMQMPVASLLQRNGQTSNVSFVFDSPHWKGVWTPTPTPQYPRAGNESIRIANGSFWRLSSTFNWNYGYSQEPFSCFVAMDGGGYTAYGTVYDKFFLTDPDGTTHPVNGQITGPCPPLPGGDPDFTFQGSTDDGTATQLNIQHFHSSNEQGSVVLKDGTQFALCFCSTRGQMTDTNGNTASFDMDM